MLDDTLKKFIIINKLDKMKEFEYSVINFRKYFPKYHKMDLITIPNEYISSSFWNFNGLIEGNIYYDFCDFLKRNDIKYEVKQMIFTDWDENSSWLNSEEILEVLDRVELEKIFKHRIYSEQRSYAIIIKYEE